MKKIPAIILSLVIASGAVTAVKGASYGGNDRQVEQISKPYLDKLFRAINSSNINLFREDLAPGFSRLITKKSFEGILSFLKKYYGMPGAVTYMGKLNRHGYTTTLWKGKWSRGQEVLVILEMSKEPGGNYLIRGFEFK